MRDVILCRANGHGYESVDERELSPDARAELDDLAKWLMLPKPRPEFHAWRSRASTPETPGDET